ncbi:SSU ribosomal protein S14p (S29e) [Candidatus Vidania fulgoroideae]|uniref:Small ribosomal subunit protein uS14 n=1 Tax=Candidatus Vidania fulgoroideorum TaxID=881286 RepID=A0A346E0P3_9PROT|nr:SSU ribosomal protein S14p (S29e) [Candidatus Vidania fulgoroideae]WDI79340.1 30S ribosomal protein S14 [Candidatus Vidania fulgoroideae]WDR79243.1 30S ribosomal protein S14 [Candidatus Vidania fulgoroideae]
MSKKSVIERNKKRNKIFFKFKKIREGLKKNLLNKYFIKILPRNSYVTRLRNRCFITGRGRGVYRKFSISRCCLREKIMNGEVSGVYKMSW